MSTRDTLERAMADILEPMGVRAVATRGDVLVTVEPLTDAYRVRLAMPIRYVDVVLDHLDIARSHKPEYLLKQLDRGRDILFHDVIEHIAKHDRSPIDRTKDLETDAAELLKALRVNLEEVRMPYGTSGAVQDAAYKLADLLRSKPGAASWSRDGFGREIAEVGPEATR